MPIVPPVALAPHEQASFERDGFVILRRLIDPDECRRFLWQSVEPALRNQGIYYDDEESWGGHYGDVIMGQDGGNHPIPPSSADSRWPALFQSERLKQVLDDLHGGKGRWKWVHGAASGVGWIHVRYPVVEPTEAWDWEDRRWHIDGDTGRVDTSQSIVVLPMVTPIRNGGGGTALLRGSHKTVARWLHDAGEWGVGNHRRVNAIVQKRIEEDGVTGAVVEATGDAGDVLLMHPMLVHAVNDARRVTFHLSSDELTHERWTAVQHGIRVSFNLSTNWSRMPLQEPSYLPEEEPRSILEHSIIQPIAQSIFAERRDPNQERPMLRYGEVVELRFVGCGQMLGVELDYGMLGYASYMRIPARKEHDLRLHAPGKPKGGAGLPVCYGDELVLKCRGAEEGTWHRLGMTAVRDLPPSARALCKRTEIRQQPLGAAGPHTDWETLQKDRAEAHSANKQLSFGEASHVVSVQRGAGSRKTTPEQLFRIEGFCDLRGVPIRAGDKFYLRSLGCNRDGAPHGCHLQADWDVDWEERVVVGSRGLVRDRMQELEAFKVGHMRSWIKRDSVLTADRE